MHIHFLVGGVNKIPAHQDSRNLPTPLYMPQLQLA